MNNIDLTIYTHTGVGVGVSVSRVEQESRRELFGGRKEPARGRKDRRANRKQGAVIELYKNHKMNPLFCTVSEKLEKKLQTL